jgi:hypothetical protein
LTHEGSLRRGHAWQPKSSEGGRPLGAWPHRPHAPAASSRSGERSSGVRTALPPATVHPPVPSCSRSPPQRIHLHLRGRSPRPPRSYPPSSVRSPAARPSQPQPPLLRFIPDHRAKTRAPTCEP